MKPFFEAQGVRIYHGDCREVIPQLDTEFTACITDPPYGLQFMGRDWDHDVPGPEYWEIVLNALLPGAPLFAFSGTRTFHRQWCAIEDAGFDLVDTLSWNYGSGFPKSHDVSKAIDKEKGVKRTDVIATRSRNVKPFDDSKGWNQNSTTGSHQYKAPATPEAETWDGWGSALKPSWEPVCYAIKPREGTYAANALKHGVAGLNIDAARIETKGERPNLRRSDADTGRQEKYGDFKQGTSRADGTTTQGRWPANVVLDEEAAKQLDEETGTLHSGYMKPGTKRNADMGYHGGVKKESATDHGTYGDSGGPSRFFYTSKASKSDRTKGMPGDAVNTHPTVKPTDLIGWLVKLATYPEKNHILDPFCGSGPLAYVASRMGIEATLIDQDEESCELAALRLQGQQSLFGQ
jgi:site-specific DNA-methyltransferase (adenine-specific)